MVDKRPHPDAQSAEDPSKRSRSSNGSPVAAPASGAKLSIQEQIAAAKARAAEIAARRNAQNGASGAQSVAQASTQEEPAAPSNTGLSAAEAARARIEAMKARINQAKTSTTTSTQRAYQSPPPPPPPQNTEDGPKSRSGQGLGASLHPALLGDLSFERSSKSRPGAHDRRGDKAKKGDQDGKKQLDLSGPSLEELRANPYYDPKLAGTGAAPKARHARGIQFNEKGKFIAQAQAIRRQAQLEEMKRRIAESTRKAGLEEDRTEQSFLVKDVPDVEWWDLELLQGPEDDKQYPDFDDDAMAAEKLLRIDTEDSIITRYVQHPVLIEPPQEKHMPAPKPMFMTKKEMAKKRRQDRMEAGKERQMKVRLGLEPPEPPKLKKGNMMRVMGEDAVRDPTAVEAMVNKQISERRDKHEQTNEERKLTQEQRHEKLAANQEKDAAKGISICAFRIDSLANGQHRYKIDINAKQHALTGITILNPAFNLVIVEGGAHSINKYKKLMLHRITWSENAPRVDRARDEPDDRDPSTHHDWLRSEDENGQLKSLDQNRCVLVWEGEVKARVFRKWSSRVCETDGDARRILERQSMENMWMAAKSYG